MADEQTPEATQKNAEPANTPAPDTDLASIKVEMVGLRRRLGFLTGLVVADTAMIIVVLIMSR